MSPSPLLLPPELPPDGIPQDRKGRYGGDPSLHIARGPTGIGAGPLPLAGQCEYRTTAAVFRSNQQPPTPLVRAE